MDAETLFLLTCDDLEQRVSRANNSDASPTQRKYEALMIAPLLRKLLLDRQSLIDRVNRAPRLKIRYPIQAWQLMAGSGGTSTPSAFDASPRPILEHFLDRVILDRDEMLSRPVMVWNDQVVTARDVIAHQANAAGGVHLGTPRSEKGRMLLELDQSINFGGIPQVVSASWLLGAPSCSDSKSFGGGCAPNSLHDRAAPECSASLSSRGERGP